MSLWERRKVSYSHFSLSVLFLLFSMLGRPLNTFHLGKLELSLMFDIKLTFFSLQADQCSRAMHYANRFRNGNVALFHKSAADASMFSIH